MKELDYLELTSINGGGFDLVKWFKNNIWVLVVGYVIEHWAELKSGIVDGYTDAKKEI